MSLTFSNEIATLNSVHYLHAGHKNLLEYLLHKYYFAVGSNCVGAHLLSDVIDNIELQSDYYQKRTLCYALKENDLLYSLYVEAGRAGKK